MRLMNSGDVDAKIVGADIALAQKIADDLGWLEVVDMSSRRHHPRRAVRSGRSGYRGFLGIPPRTRQEKEVDFSNIYDEVEARC